MKTVFKLKRYSYKRVINNSCTCSGGASYYIVTNSCKCNNTYVLLNNFTCQQCLAGSNYSNYGDGTCICLGQVYSSTNNSCSCSQQYLKGNSCTSQCSANQDLILNNVCVSYCSTFYSMIVDNKCVSQCYSPFSFTQQQYCVTICNGSFVQNGSQCKSNCAILYDGNNNYCSLQCSSSLSISQQINQIVLKQCSSIQCQSMIYISLSSSTSIYMNVTILLSNQTVNNSQLNVSSIWFSNGQNYSILNQISSLFNFQLVGQLQQIPQQTYVALLSWNQTVQTSFYCVYIKPEKIQIQFYSMLIFCVNNLFNQQQLQIISVHINTDIVSVSGFYCIVNNQSVYAQIFIYNVTINGSLSTLASNNSVLFCTANNSNIAILNLVIQSSQYQVNTNSAIFCNNDTNSTFAFTNAIITVSGTLIGANSTAHGGLFTNSNITFLNSIFQFQIQTINSQVSSGTIIGRAVSATLVQLIQSSISGVIQPYTGWSTSFFGSLSNTNGTNITQISMNASILSAGSQNLIGFFCYCVGFTMQHCSAIGIVNMSKMVSGYFGVIAQTDTTQAQISYSTFVVSLVGALSTGVVGYARCGLAMSSCTVVCTVQGTNEIGLLCGQLLGPSSINSCNVSGRLTAIFNASSSLNSAGVVCGITAGTINNFTSVNILSADVFVSGNGYAGAFIGCHYSGGANIFNSTVSNVIADTSKFGMVVGYVNASFGIQNTTIKNCSSTLCCGTPTSCTSWGGANASGCTQYGT